MALTSWHLQNNNNLAAKFPQFLHLWHPIKNGDLTPDKVTPYSTKKVWVLFKCGHETIRTVFNLVKGYGCPFCAPSGPKLLKGFNDLETKNPTCAKKWHPILNGSLKPSMVTEFSHKSVWWQCDCGESYFIQVSEVSQERYKGCRKCNEKHRRETNLARYGTHTSMLVPKFKEKYAKTSTEKYGTPFPMSNPQVSLKSIRNGKKCQIINHWQTNEELLCTASYEIEVVNSWNTNKIDFQWQIPIKIPADIPDIGGKTYFIDAYIPGQNLYVEIKGAWRGNKINEEFVSKLKWEWFHKTYPNSELWDKTKLKSLGFKII